MLKFTTRDGDIVEGNTPSEILENLKNLSIIHRDQELEEYLQNQMNGFRDLSDSMITAREHDDYFLDLISTGYLTPLR